MNTVISGLYVLYRKELADHLRSRRFALILLIVAVTSLASVYSAGLGIREAVEEGPNDFVFLKLFTTSGGSLPSLITFLSFLGPLVGLSLGFDAINGERNRGTLSRLMAQPIHRDAIINAKFLAGCTVLAIMLISLTLAVSGFGIILIGIPPTLEEISRILIYMLLTIVYMALWLGISQLFSLFFRQTATSALAGIALWLFLVVFMDLLAGLIANALVPIGEYSLDTEILRNYSLRQNISRISPTTLYDEAVVTILNPGVRALGIVLTSQLEGAIAGPLPLGQSLLLIWPHLTGILAATIICFAISYVYFMRQEIRA